MTLQAWFVGLMLSVFAAGPAAAAEDVDETRDTSADGHVSVKVVRGRVTLQGWDKSAVRVTGRLDERTTEFVFDVKGDATNIEVRLEDDGGWWFASGHESDLTIYLPAASRLEMNGISTDVEARALDGAVEIGLVSGDVYLRGGSDRVSVRTISGDLELRDGRGRAELSTVSGNIGAYNLDGAARYSTVSGNVFIEGGGSEELHLESVSGDLEIRKGEVSAIRGETVSGNVYIEADPGAGRIEFDSVSGAMRLHLGGEVNARFDVETRSGAIHNLVTDDEPGVSRQGATLRFTLGEGDGEVILGSLSGDISLRPR